MPHHPLALAHVLQIHQRRRPALAALIFVQAPTADMMRARDDTGLDPFGHPNFVDEVTDLRMDFEQIAGLDVEILGIFRIDPERVAIGYFVQPLGVPRPRVNQGRQAKCGKQQHFAGIEIDIVGMHMALDVAGNGMLRPLPILQRLGKKFQLTRRRGKADARFAVDFDANRVAVFYD